MDPVKQIVNPVAEVRQHASRFIDEYGEEWVVIDGIETKVPNIKQAKADLARTDAVRAQCRADLDAAGIRFNSDGSDREEQVEITLEDGTKTTVGLLKPGDANYMQIGQFEDAAGLLAAAETTQAKVDAEAEHQRRIAARAAFRALPWHKRLFRKAP